MSVHRSAPPRKPGPDSTRPRWRRWLLRGALAGLALLLVVGVPMVWVLDKQVRAEFDALAWQVPTRVYARPLLLKPGLRLDAATLELELAAAGYRKDGGGDVPGTYLRDGGRFRIGTRAFTDLDGPVPARKLEVVVSGGRIARVTDRASGKRAEGARLDPARIATLYGNAQEERRLVQLKEVPSLLVTGLQAVEDRDFKDHHGIDPWGMMRAMWVNVREGELEQGASTLTQQLVRSLFLTREKRWSRKFKEIAYSLIIEARYDKQRILEAYLNQVYLGQQGNQQVFQGHDPKTQVIPLHPGHLRRRGQRLQRADGSLGRQIAVRGRLVHVLRHCGSAAVGRCEIHGDVPRWGVGPTTAPGLCPQGSAAQPCMSVRYRTRRGAAPRQVQHRATRFVSAQT